MGTCGGGDKEMEGMRVTVVGDEEGEGVRVAESADLENLNLRSGDEEDEGVRIAGSGDLGVWIWGVGMS